MRSDRNKKITIKQESTTQDEYGQPTHDWTTVVTCWASIEPVIGKEFYAAEQAQSDVTIKIRTEYITGILPKMKIVYATRIFEIDSVINYKEQNRDLIFMCRELI